MKTVPKLIAERTAFFNAHIAAGTPEVSEEDLKPLLVTYDALTEAWQAAPCRDLSDIRTKVRFVLQDENVLDNLRTNEGELQRFLGSIVLATHGLAIDAQDAVNTARYLIKALALMANGLPDQMERNAFSEVAESAIDKLDEAQS